MAPRVALCRLRSNLSHAKIASTTIAYQTTYLFMFFDFVFCSIFPFLLFVFVTVKEKEKEKA
jgi:hypothetical protein